MSPSGNLGSSHSRIKSPIMDASWSSALMGLGGNPMPTNGMKAIYSPPDQGFNQRKPSSRLQHTHEAGSPPRIMCPAKQQDGYGWKGNRGGRPHSSMPSSRSWH